MRRTGNTRAAPTIGTVVAGTGKIGFGVAWASARLVCEAAPASASAPVASIVLRSTVFMAFSLSSLLFLRQGVSRPARCARQDNGNDFGGHKKGPRQRGPFLALTRNQCLISGGSLPPFAASLVITCLCSHTFMVAESLVSPV